MSLHVLRRGPADGIPLVLVHGFPFDARMWRLQLDSLAHTARLIAYDIRGFGRSPAGDGQVTMETYVDDLLAVLDAEGVRRAVLCGLSMGGYVILRAAEREPGRVRGLVLCDTKSAADPDGTKLARAATLRRVKEEGTGFLVEEFPSKVLVPSTLEERPEVVEAVREMIAAASGTGICGALLAMAGRTDTTEALADMDVPALVIVGEEDPITPPATGRAMAERLPRAELRVVSGAGHLSNLDNPREFDAALLNFLREL